MGAPILAVAWLREADYPTFRRLDPAGLPASYDEWLRNAERGLEEFKRQGLVFEIVEIDPKELVRWCRARGAKVDGRARMRLAVEIAHRRRQN